MLRFKELEFHILGKAKPSAKLLYSDSGLLCLQFIVENDQCDNKKEARPFIELESSVTRIVYEYEHPNILLSSIQKLNR